MSQMYVIATKLVFTAGTVIWLGTAPVAADQSFVCKDGSVVTVAHKDLGRMKRSNACVASYYGGLQKTVEVVEKADEKAEKSADAIELRPTQQAQSQRKKNAHAQLMTRSHVQAAAPQPAAVNTDYRNVRILNAKPNGETIFKHRY